MLGLSNTSLPPPGKFGQLIRHELLLLARESFGRQNIPALVQQVAQEAIDRNRAYLAGDVIGPRGVLFENTALEALYVTNPVCLPKAFSSCTLSTGDVAVIAWSVPITRSESDFIRNFGWGKFQDALVATDPDFLDFNGKTAV
jgi:hypothetical protein